MRIETQGGSVGPVAEGTSADGITVSGSVGHVFLGYRPQESLDRADRHQIIDGLLDVRCCDGREVHLDELTIRQGR